MWLEHGEVGLRLAATVQAYRVLRRHDGAATEGEDQLG